MCALPMVRVASRCLLFEHSCLPCQNENPTNAAKPRFAGVLPVLAPLRGADTFQGGECVRDSEGCRPWDLSSVSRRLFLGSVTGLAAPLFWRAPDALAAVAQSERHDLIVAGGRVLDGSGRAAVRADVAVTGDRIVGVGNLSGAQAARRIDAAGQLVAPGFIDVHSHAAEGLARQGLEQGQPLLAQGITTIVGNPDGGGPIDLASQRQTLERRGLGPNVALLIGHGSLRAFVVGQAAREPTAQEQARMESVVDRAMGEGAFGLSSGLFYAPGSFAKTEELVGLARRVAPFDGVYTSHIRDEGNYGVGLLASVDEVIRIAEEGRAIGIVSHMKALGPDTWGRAVDACQHIEAARARGVRVFADQYPYDASSTSLSAALVPRWAQDGGDAGFVARLADVDVRPKLLAEMTENLRRRGGAASIQVAHYRPDRALEGRTLEAIARARQLEPTLAALELLQRGGVSIVSFNMSERDIEHICRQRWTMTSSDGGLVPLNEGVPHPRNYGAFTRKLTRYVRERRVVSIEGAIQSMTGLPAEVFGLTDRGRVAPGAAADLVVFDPAKLRETATYTQPHQLAQGMSLVLVNGTVVLENGQFTDARPGRVLRRTARTAA
jgi:N-acyl-D-amino-acid deacylase